MGFGHRVYKNYDPRAKLMQRDLPRGARTSSACTTIRCSSSPWRWRRSRCDDDYFVERKLYPNVDFYSGIMLQRASASRVDCSPCIFALARTVGWIAQLERDDRRRRSIQIGRPRQAVVRGLAACATCRPRVSLR
jgi:citrate synthase